MAWKIRTENPGDYEAVRLINYEAFGKRDDEADLVERIRQSPGFVPELSLVALDGEEVVGHVLLSEACVTKEEEDRSHTVLALAPIAVAPARQKSGVGSALMAEALRRARELPYGLVLLIGHPSYYPRFGFHPARSYGLELKQFEVPDDVFMACELKEGELGRVRGELRYPDAFFG